MEIKNGLVEPLDWNDEEVAKIRDKFLLKSEHINSVKGNKMIVDSSTNRTTIEKYNNFTLVTYSEGAHQIITPTRTTRYVK